MKEIIRDKYEHDNDLNWYRNFDTVSTMKHNVKFEQYCDRNVYTKQWWNEYYQCCYLLNVIIDHKKITERVYQNYEQHFMTAVKVFNFIEENEYIKDPFKEDLNILTDGLLQAWKNIWLVKNKQEKAISMKDIVQFLTVVIKELELIEKEELQCL